MSLSLSNDDSCAVDLLLERGHTPNGGNGGGMSPCFTTAPSDSVLQRLTRVEQILHLLDYHTAAEPASDLVARTLARCERTAAIQTAAIPAAVTSPIAR
jgi:hypothetical protein